MSVPRRPFHLAAAAVLLLLAWAWLELVYPIALVPSLDGNLIKIMPAQEAAGSPKNPTAMNSTNVPPKTYDQYSTHIVKVKHADPSELSSALKIFA